MSLRLLTIPWLATLCIFAFWCHRFGGLLNGLCALLWAAICLVPILMPWAVAVLLAAALMRYAGRRT